MDGTNEGCDLIHSFSPLVYIDSSEPMGASRGRNIGASSIPKYRRQQRVCFFDDDVWLAKGWDTAIEQVLDAVPGCVVSAYAHPFNHPLGLYDIGGVQFHAAGVLSTVNMAMSWEMWDDIGFFQEPGGASGSEDVAFCRTAIEKGYGLATTHPHRLIHTGLVSSKGERIVGYELLQEQNKKLEEVYGVRGQVIYG